MFAKISEIKINNRFRKDYGDIESLAKSIEEIGLLHPIVINSDFELVCGGRRVEAMRLLGREEIAARIIDIESVILGEYAENEVRKDFTDSERVAIARAIEESLQGRHGGDRRSEDFKVQNFAQSNYDSTDEQSKVENFPPCKGEKSRDIAAQRAGFGNGKTYQQAKNVVDNGVPELVKKMDDGDVSIFAASTAASFPEEEQREIVSEIDAGEKPSEVIKKHVLATKHTGDEESYTPIEYLESAREVLGKFDLDPASNEMAQANVRADLFYTVDDDGLSKEWSGKVWMNPPYTARVINAFISKLVDHYKNGDITDAIVLTNNNTDTSWFHEAANTASAVCFTAGRINFLKRDGSRSSPTNGQSFIYFGKDIEKFKSVFSKHGIVMVKA